MWGLVVLAYIEIGLGVGFGLHLAFAEKLVYQPRWSRPVAFAIHSVLWPGALAALVTLMLADRAGR